MLYISQILILLIVLVKNNEHTLTISFENIRDNNGTILVGIYTDEKGWKKKTPTYEMIISKTSLIDGRLSSTIPELKEGVYGIAVLDDVNDNQVVDMGFIFPKEGFGFSNYEHKTWFLPAFEDFDFDYPQVNKITIRMRYLEED